MQKIVIPVISALCLSMLSACGAANTNTNQTNDGISASLSYESSMELDYAKEFSVDYYNDGYSLIHVGTDSEYLLVPEGKEDPYDLKDGIVSIKQPVNNIYLVASAVMDMFVSMDGLDQVAYSALNADSWYIDEAREALTNGNISYAGKYNAPDYEQIIAGGCGLAIENTMIFHSPEVKEQLESFGIPVMVDYSSYEESPLGRTEWVKLYGLITGKEEEANKAYEAQKKAFDDIANGEKTDKTVAFFYITSNGEANVRKSNDYLAKMIEMAGGSYVFKDLGANDDTQTSTVSMTMEEFYNSCVNADYLIYNSTIDGELKDMSDLLGKSELFKNFKAVTEGNVYCTTKNMYQSSMELGTIISDLYYMLSGEHDKMTYLYQVK